MTRKSLLLLLPFSASTLLAIGHTASAAEDTKAKRPNFIVILADDYGNDSYAINNPQTDDLDWPDNAPVPNLATLAEHGVNFQNGWSMPGCTQTRGARTLGLLPSTSGIGDIIGAPTLLFGGATNTPRFGSPGPFENVEFPPTMINPNNPNLIQRILKNAGYRTLKVGKWHETEVPVVSVGGEFPTESAATSRIVQDVLDSGFDAFHGFVAGAPNTPWGGTAPVTIVTSEIDDSANPNGPTQYRSFETNEFVTSNLIGRTIEFVNEQDGAPFFIALDLAAPHFADPATGASYFVAPGPNEPAPAGVADWRTLDPEIHANVIAQVNAAFPGEAYPPAGTGATLLPVPNAQAQRRAAFKSLIAYLDVQLGRLLEHVDLDNTYVIFLGDNGTQGEILGNPGFDVVEAPNDPARSKGTLYRNGVEVPFIIAGPGVVRPGRDSSALINAVDILATVTDLAGIQQPEETKGQSFSAKRILKGEPGLRPVNIAEFFAADGTVGGVGAPFDLDGRVVASRRYRLIAQPVLVRNSNGTPDDPGDDFNEFVCRADFTPSGDPVLDEECYDPVAGIYKKKHQLEFYDIFLDPREEDGLTMSEMSLSQRVGFLRLCLALNRISLDAQFFQNGRVCDPNGSQLIDSSLEFSVDIDTLDSGLTDAEWDEVRAEMAVEEWDDLFHE